MAYKQVKYSVAALFIGPTGSTSATADHSGKVVQLHRVTSVNDSFDIPLQDAIQLGQMAPFSRENISTPTPTVTFDYYVTNGANEKRMGFNVNETGDGNTIGAESFLKDILATDTDEKNYFISFVPEGNDHMGYDTATNGKVVGIGNGYITNYSLNASVGDFITSSVTVEGLNYDIRNRAASIQIPAINPDTGELASGTYSLPTLTEDSSMPKVLKPGDIEIDFADWADKLGLGLVGEGKAHIQSFSLEVPLARTPLERLGSNYAFSRELDFPINATFSIEANVADLQTGSLSTIINGCADSVGKDVVITLKDCSGDIAMRLDLKGLTQDSESFQLSTGGGGRTASVSFTCSIGGPQDTTHNIFVVAPDAN